MKFFYQSVLTLVLLASTVLISCNKTDLNQAKPQATSVDEDALGRQHSCCSCCPTVVPEAYEISYSLTNFGAPQAIGISVDVFYMSPEVDGSLRSILRYANGGTDTISVTHVQQTAPGESGVVHLEYFAPYDAFPCTLQVNGRPLSLDCPARTRKYFQIEYGGVSKQAVKVTGTKQ